MTQAQRLTIGVISDTHGLLRPEIAQRLAGVAHIVHAGDIGRPDVIAGTPSDSACHWDQRERRYWRLGGATALRDKSSEMRSRVNS